VALGQRASRRTVHRDLAGRQLASFLAARHHSPARQRAEAADLHGDDQVWDGDQLRLVVDFETVAAAEPERELRAFPVPGWFPAWGC
jgi:hypothetical protein